MIWFEIFSSGNTSNEIFLKEIDSFQSVSFKILRL